MDAGEILQRLRERWLHLGQAKWIAKVGTIQVADAFDSSFPHILEAKEAPQELRKALQSTAKSIRNGEWKIFGWKAIDVGNPPQWNLEGLLGIKVSVDKKSNHRSLPHGADARVVWEINRWSELTRLAMHAHVNAVHDDFILTQTWLSDWIKSHPMGVGLPWRSSLEVAIRILNFAWIDALIEYHAKELSSETLKQQEILRKEIVLCHTAWVQRYLSFGSSANNHRLGELVGLYVAAKRWPNVAQTLGLDCSFAADEIKKCLLNQFHVDGGNKEQALHYQLFAMEMFEQARAFGWCADQETSDLMMKAKDFFVRANHSHESWEYGDNDDAELVPVCARRDTAVEEWMGWILNEKTGAGLEYWLGQVPNLISPVKGWQVRESSGFALYEGSEWKIRLDASELGFGKMAAHGHLDALHVSVWSGQHALIIDPGTGSYFGNASIRTKFASWEMHNGPLPSEGYKTPRRYGTFLWGQAHRHPKIAVTQAGAEARFVHEGHQFVRSIEVSPDQESITIRDRESLGSSFTTHWIFNPAAHLVELSSPQERRFLLTLASRRWRIAIDGAVSAELGNIEVSPKFGKIVEAQSLLIKGMAELKVKIESLRSDT